MGERRILMVGDVMGESGLLSLERHLPGLRKEQALDFIVVNGENAAAGFGLSEETLDRILAAGADIVSSGNHVWEKRDFWPRMESDERVLRPANYPSGAVGRGVAQLERDGVHYCVINLQGREFMEAIDSPFAAIDTLLEELGAAGKDRIVLIDFHAESSQEKEALALYVDGRVSALVGTHTHVATSDGRILKGGTGYQTDIGMTGVQEAVIGMETAVCIERMKTNVLHRMSCAEGSATLCAVILSIDDQSGHARSIERLEIRGA